MTLKKYLIVMSISTLVCWATWISVLFIINPKKTNWLGLLFFYASLFLALSGSMAILGFLIRFIALKQELVYYQVITAFRQSFLFAFLIIAILFLKSKSMLYFWNVIFLILGLTALEFFLISYKKN